MPVSGLTAWQALHQAGRVAAGQRVLAEAPEAIAELGAGRVRGKAVIDVAALS